jgi:hypothetical protein
MLVCTPRKRHDNVATVKARRFPTLGTTLNPRGRDFRRRAAFFDLCQWQASKDSFVMIDIEAKLNCERHIADLKLCPAKRGFGAWH